MSLILYNADKCCGKPTSGASGLTIEVKSIPYGEEPTVENTGTDAAPVYLIGIPEGKPGDADAVDLSESEYQALEAAGEVDETKTYYTYEDET